MTSTKPCQVMNVATFLLSDLNLQAQQGDNFQASTAGVAHSSSRSAHPFLLPYSAVDPGDFTRCPHCHLVTSSADIKQHISHYHGNQMPVQCSQCGKGFFSVSGLKHHMLIHKGLRFRCPICDATFTQKSKVKRHLKGVHGCLPCVSCSGTFQIGLEYDQHVLNCHR